MNTLPKQLDPFRYAQQEQKLDAMVALDVLPRIKDLLVSCKSNVAVHFSFYRDASGFNVLDLKIEGALLLLCQRSLEPFDYAYTSSSTLCFLKDGADDQAVPESYEIWPMDAPFIDPYVLVEEELLLGIPPAPVNPFSKEIDLGVKNGYNGAPSGTHQPFAVLKDLKNLKEK